AGPRHTKEELPRPTGGGPPGCPPLSILSATPFASQTSTPTPLSSTTRQLTRSLRPNSPSRSPNGTLGANSSNTAGGSSTPSGSAGSNKPGPRVRAVATQAPAPSPPGQSCLPNNSPTLRSPNASASPP